MNLNEIDDAIIAFRNAHEGQNPTYLTVGPTEFIDLLRLVSDQCAAYGILTEEEAAEMARRPTLLVRRDPEMVGFRLELL